MPLREERFLENAKSGSLFGIVQCANEVPENLRNAFANFPPIFKNTKAGRHGIGPLFRKNMLRGKEI